MKNLISIIFGIISGILSVISAVKFDYILFIIAIILGGIVVIIEVLKDSD